MKTKSLIIHPNRLHWLTKAARVRSAEKEVSKMTPNVYGSDSEYWSRIFFGDGSSVDHVQPFATYEAANDFAQSWFNRIRIQTDMDVVMCKFTQKDTQS